MTENVKPSETGGIVTNLDIQTLLSEVMSKRRIPGATYRLQFNSDFTFRDAIKLVPYLNDLGITDLYASPILKARKGSTHGYDVVDHSQLNPELGTPADFAELAALLKKNDMGLILDIVPNHMGNGPQNRWWLDVLEHGPTSAYARYFDINWRPTKQALANKVLLPILGAQYGQVLEAGDLHLRYADGAFTLTSNDMELPIAVGTCSAILEYSLTLLTERDDAVMELESIIRALRNLPPYTDFAPEQVAVRQTEEIVIRRRLATLTEYSESIASALEQAVASFNGTPDDRASFDPLDSLIALQPYHLAYWRVAADEINYRRFFDINDMAAITVELPEVFSAVHDFVFELLAQGQVTGLRIDHPDGLWDPTTYFQQLQEGFVRAWFAERAENPALAEAAAAAFLAYFRPGDGVQPVLPVYVVAEKILSEIEPLPETWAIDGTTGYDFAVAANGIFINRDNVHAFESLYSRFIGRSFDYRELIYTCKQLTMEFGLASELNARSQQLANIASQNRHMRDFTLVSLGFALREITANLSIYRTYITSPGDVSDRDRFYLSEAVEQAKARNPRASADVFDFVHQVLLLENLTDFPESQRREVVEFVMQFQQITGPVMAKSVEDTAFYIYNRLVSLNEVGSNPEQFGISLEDFHKHNAWHEQHWSHTMLGSSTHDTKRSEDVRARLNVLSEIPAEWEQAIWRWSGINEGSRTRLADGSIYPDRNDEYLIYQTLVGAFPDTPEELPAFRERVTAYMEKATNEAKVHTNWSNRNAAYHDSVKTFIDGLFANTAFMDDLSHFQSWIASFGRWNSLSQTLLKLTSPGVPDVYQGTELWDLSLVDPDNRRPVDYVLRREALATLKKRFEADPAALTRELVDQAVDGRIKLHIITKALNLRCSHRDLFEHGDYTPLEVRGAKARHVCAFLRRSGDESLIVVVPVLITALMGGRQGTPIGGDVWGDTHLVLPEGSDFVNVFTGETYGSGAGGVLAVGGVLGSFPVALLHLTPNPSV